MQLEDIILNNQRLIHKATHYFKNYPNKEDLFQVGVIGMIKAFDSYKEEYDTKFTTYAFLFILGEMKKYIRNDKSIKISRDITSLNLKIEKVKILLTQKYSREPSIKELSDYLEVEEKYIIDALKFNNCVDSLDISIKTDSKELNLYDFIPDKIDDIDLLIELKTSLEKLTDFERELIINRYMKDLSQSETANILGISQVQVSRNEKKVLNKLKTIMQ